MTVDPDAGLGAIACSDLLRGDGEDCPEVRAVSAPIDGEVAPAGVDGDGAAPAAPPPGLRAWEVAPLVGGGLGPGSFGIGGGPAPPPGVPHAAARAAPPVRERGGP